MALNSSFDTAKQGLNFQVAQLKAQFDVLLIQVGTQLMPVFEQLVQHVAPVITQFATWLAQMEAALG